MKTPIPLLAIFLLLIIAAVARGQSSVDKIVITYPSRSIASVDLYIAQERGFFRQEGLLADVVQVRGNIGVTALLSGDAHAVNNVGTVIRAMERSDLPVKVITQSLKKNLFWLVTKPEVKSLSELKGKIFGTTTFGGAQHLAAARLLQKAGLNPDKDITVVIGGDVPAQLQSLVSGTIQLAALSPPTVILARDKFKLKIHGSTLDDLPNLQNGLAFTEKMLREKRELVRRILRARSRAHRYFWENERGTAEVLANYLKVELPIALESIAWLVPPLPRMVSPQTKKSKIFSAPTPRY
jgi:NitT/TauT family transport system substrate-binding protein